MRRKVAVNVEGKRHMAMDLQGHCPLPGSNAKARDRRRALAGLMEPVTVPKPSRRPHRGACGLRAGLPTCRGLIHSPPVMVELLSRCARSVRISPGWWPKQ